MKTLPIAFTLLVAVSVRAQLPAASPKAAGFDPVRLEVMHAAVKRFADEGKHAGIITLLARNRKIVDFQTYGCRDVEGSYRWSATRFAGCIRRAVDWRQGRNQV